MDDAVFREAVDLATLAPSVHNTQPWRFRHAGDRIEVHADRNRSLPVLDPAGRQLAISCGAATEFLVMALRVAGHAAEVAEAPDPDDPDLLATVTVTGDYEPTDDDWVTVRAATVRHTHRGTFDPAEVPADVVDALRRSGTDPRTWVHVVHTADEMLMLAALLERADAAERADPAYQEELAAWRQRGSAPGSTEGIPDSAMQTETPRSSLTLRDFRGGEGPEQVAAQTEHPLVTVLVSEADDVADWVRSGRALARLTVRAAERGLMGSPLGQVVDLPWYRTALSTELALGGHAQMVLRIGYPAGETGASAPRRSPDAVVEGPPGSA